MNHPAFYLDVRSTTVHVVIFAWCQDRSPQGDRSIFR